MKFSGTTGAREIPPAPVGLESASEGRTRDLVARLILESGPMTAAALAERIDLSAAAIRRHLDALVEDGLLTSCDARPALRRGRGRPARTYKLTDKGRAAFPHGYDDLATTALRYLRATGGEAAVTDFAEHRARALEVTLVEGGVGPLPVEAHELALALSSAGYASSTESAGVGTQLCQHHCPVAHVAAEFPELCEAETRAFERMLGTYVQRLATIAHGDGVCTTHIPLANPKADPVTTSTTTTNPRPATSRRASSPDVIAVPTTAAGVPVRPIHAQQRTEVSS